MKNDKHKQAPYGERNIYIKFVKKYPFFSSSFFIHVLAAWAIISFGIYTYTEKVVAKNKDVVSANMSAANRHVMRHRVEDMKAIQKLMDRISESQSDAAAAEKKAQQAAATENKKSPAEQAQDQKNKAEQTANAAKQTPQQILAEAKAVNDSIKTLEQKIKAEELAKLLKIPKQEAEKRIQEDTKNDAKKDTAPLTLPKDIGSLSEEQIDAEIARYEAESKKVLQRRQETLERQANGTQVKRDEQQAASEKSADNGKDQNAGGASAATSSQHGGAAGATSNNALMREIKSLSNQLLPSFNSYGDYIAPPPVNYNNLRISTARMFGDDAPYANRIYLNSWFVIGPFAGDNKESLNVVYPPEKIIDLDAVYFGKNKRLLKWNFFETESYPYIPPGDANNAVYYGYTEVMMDQDRDMIAVIGGDDDSKIWVNERLVWTSGNQMKDWYRGGGYRNLHQEIKDRNLSEGYRKIHFHKGRNQILFKLYNSSADFFISIVLVPDVGVKGAEGAEGRN